MTKIETLKDLMIAGDVTRSDIERLARSLFNGEVSIGDNSLLADAYTITLPRFDDLPDREQGYLVKVLLECPVRNTLEARLEEIGPENTELDSELLAGDEFAQESQDDFGK